MMATERRVAKNAAFLLVGQVVQALCALALWLLIARILNPDAIGQYALAVALAAIFANVCKVGYESLAIREVARHRELAAMYLGDILILKGGLSLLGFLLLVATVLAIHYPAGKGNLILVVGATTFVAALVAGLEWCFRAFERMEYQGGISVFRGLATLGFGAGVLWWGGDILGVALAQLVTICFTFGLVFIVIRRRFARPAWRLDWSDFGAMTRQALPFGVGIFVTVLLFNVDTVMLSHLKGDTVTGLYNVAYRLVDTLKILPIAIASALYPPLSHAFLHDRDGLTALVTKAWYLMVIAALPIAVGTALLANRFIVLFFGARYAPAGPVLAMLIWAGALMFLFSVLGITFSAIDRQPTGAGIVFMGMLINIGLNIVFIPWWGAWGASLALVIAMAVMTTVGLVILARHLAIPRWGSPMRYFSMGLATVVMAAGVWSLRGANLAVVILVGAVIYTVTIVATRGLRWADLHVLRQPVSG